MSPIIVEFSGKELVGTDAFHDAFTKGFGFFEGYGRNMDAWIDCMGYLRDPDEKMSALHIGPQETLTIVLRNFEALRDNAPEQWRALIECTDFVNHRAIEGGEMPLIALAF